MTTASVLFVSLLAGLLLWGLETAHSILAGGPSAGGLRTHLPFAMLLLLLFSGWGVAAGLIQAVCLSLVRFVGRRVERRRGPSPGRLAAAAFLAAICSADAVRSTFPTDSACRTPSRPLLHPSAISDAHGAERDAPRRDAQGFPAPMDASAFSAAFRQGSKFVVR